jgi:hypothetical protein
MIEGNAGKYNSEDGRIRVCIDGQTGTTKAQEELAQSRNSSK